MARPLYADKRLLSVGFLIGAAVGAWAGNRARELAARPAASPALIDWTRARGIAVGMNRESGLAEAERASLHAYYRELVERAVPLVAAYTGDELPGALEHVYAFDRIDWINANIDGFIEMFKPLEALNPLTAGPSGPRTDGLLWGGLNQTVLSAEIGFLLGYLARRVLGQYDLALLGREPLSGGRLYFVHPNITMVERALRLPSDDFRMWLTLHEVTHAFEFEAHPWLRQHVNEMIERYFAHLSQDVEQLKRGFAGLRSMWDRVRQPENRNGNWIELVMTPEQRALFGQMQATMSVVEGYSNHVMNAVGRSLIPSYDVITRRFERRQQQRTPAEHLFARLTGLDIKLEQYRQGEAFVNAIVRERGHDFARRLWDGPEMLPTIEEIRDPARWIARVA